MRKIGIDISKQWFDCCDLGRERSKQFSNTGEGFAQFIHWAGADIHVIMEATGVYYLGLATWLVSGGYRVSVINPLVIRRYGQMQLSRTKTDAKDAAMIARYGQEQSPPLWNPPSDFCQALQQLLSLREGFLKQQTMLSNQQEAFSRYPQPDPLVGELIAGQKQTLCESIAKINERLEQLVQAHYKTILECLLTIPGIGKQTAITLICITDGFTKFDDARKLASYVGICPRIWQSGSSVNGRAAICKLGCGYMRKLLYMCSWTAKTANPACAVMYKRLAGKGKPEKVIKVAIAHKLLRQAFAVATKQDPFNKKLALAA